MTDPNAHLLAIYTSLLLTGLAASLHCIGMCGPILLSFAQVFEQTSLTLNGRPVAARHAASRWRTLGRDFACYHAGRIWTYAMLGFALGWLGQRVRESIPYLNWQAPLALGISTTVILAGILLLGVAPTEKIRTWLSGCGLTRLLGQRPFSSLLHSRGWLPRLLLGVVMGLLPCGLVYAVLFVTATLPSPLHSALGMVVFGLGTLPSLTTVLLARNFVPPRLRAHGTRFAAVIIILAGSWMMGRALVGWSQSTGHDGTQPSCHGRISGTLQTQPINSHPVNKAL